MNDKLAILLVALLIDVLFGDPPNRYHPVAWMGSLISAAWKQAPASNPGQQFAYGGLIALGGAGTAAGVGWLIAGLVGRLPRPLSWLGGGMLLKLMFSLRGLAQAADDVRRALIRDDLIEARRYLGWHLVSRDTSMLNPSQIVAASIESIAENTSDSIIAPLCYYAALGLPGALAYRFANTADAMLGYHDMAREWLGKVPARFDDLLNLLPSRLTALLFVAAARITGDDARQALSIWSRDSDKTASPNAGHPMSAVAGALGVELEKTGQYRLGKGNREPVPADIKRGVRLMQVAALLGVGVAILVMGPGSHRAQR